MKTKSNPKISIIVPCYNMETYIEKTLLSIINQDYKEKEIIIIDGESSDNTLKIIEKYKDDIAIIISEKDKGQYNAINKGMQLATGEIMAWLNADDIYFSWTLEIVANFFKKHPNQLWISGSTAVMNNEGILKGLSRNVIAKPRKFVKNGWFRENLFGYLQQEGMFWKKELWNKHNGIDENYKLAADFELWTRFSKSTELVSFGLPLAAFRVRTDSRSNAQKDLYENEVLHICENLRRPSSIRQYLGNKNLFFKILMRKLTIRKSPIYYFSATRNEWILKTKYTTMTGHTMTTLLSLK